MRILLDLVHGVGWIFTVIRRKYDFEVGRLGLNISKLYPPNVNLWDGDLLTIFEIEELRARRAALLFLLHMLTSAL